MFDDELGPLARDYVGADAATDLAATLLWQRPRASLAVVGGRDGQGGRARRPTSWPRALDTAGSWLRRDLGEPVGLDLGPHPHDPVPGVNLRRQRHRAPRVVLQHARGRRGRRRRGRRQQVLPPVARLPGPYDPDFEPAATLPGAVLGHERPLDAGAVRHERPGRRRGSSRRPARAACRSAAMRTTGSAKWLANETVPLPFTRRGHRRRGGRDAGAHPEPLTRSGRSRPARRSGRPGPSRGREALGPRVPWTAMPRDRDLLLGTLAAVVAASCSAPWAALTVRRGGRRGRRRLHGVARDPRRGLPRDPRQGPGNGSFIGRRGPRCSRGAGGRRWRPPRSWASPSTSRCSRHSGWCRSPSP